MEGASTVVSGFLAKLWALVDDSSTDDVIGWSRNGQSFSILDEQKFAKELLPKYFKHNNLSSFVRQLNMYGFHKVVAVDSGVAAPEKTMTIEFQHSFFKQGEPNLLENIKRKVPSGKMEDLKGSSDDLQKALAELQEVREQQVGVDNKLASMKRSLPDASGSPPSKLSCQCAPIPVESGEAEDVLDSGPSVDNDSSAIMIQDVTSSVDDGLIGLVTPLSPSQTLNLIGSPSFSGEPSDLLEGGDHISPVHMMPSFGLDLDMTNCPLQITEDSLEADDIGDLPLDLHSSQTSDSEDTAAVIDSILNGDHLSDQSMGFMNRDEMQDFMNCIETNLEDLHSMLAARKLAEDTGLMFEASTPEFPDLNMNEAGPSSSMNDVLDLPDIAGEDGMMDEFGAAENRDMQLVQYMGNPLLSLFDDLPSFEDRPQDDRDLLAEFEDDNNMPTFLEDSDDPLCLVAPSLSDDSENPLESFESPLLLEDPNGEYKLFPLLLLSPVASFIEEATEMENTT